VKVKDVKKSVFFSWGGRIHSRDCRPFFFCICFEIIFACELFDIPSMVLCAHKILLFHTHGELQVLF